MSLRHLAALFVALLSAPVFAADRLAASPQPPADLAPADVPQFILLGFDDNPAAEPINWITGYLEAKRNPAGAGHEATFDDDPVRMIFFSNGKYWNDGATVAAHRRAFAAGHEVANHTQNHQPGGKFTAAEWSREMDACDEAFAAGGIPRDRITGFRTPFLGYNAATFAALAATGRRYDSSIEEGRDEQQDGTNFLWPYTLDTGSPGNSQEFTADSGRRVGDHPGLWEIPIHMFMVPADADCGRYGVAPGLRARIGANLKVAYGGGSGEPADRITGLDWNVFEAAKCTGPEFLAILKHTLDLRLAGNRAPFMVGGHTALYPANNPARRKALEDFVAYALTKPQVRFVTGGQLIDWLNAPAALK
jgi:peptidoglycan/xylan/chitin deacetylase (PgdA/CDA1 family)